MTDRETGEVAAIAFPATAVAVVAICAAAACAAAACAAFVAKVSIGARSSGVFGPLSAAARPSCLGVSERQCVHHAARVHAKLAMAECPDGSLEIWPVTGSTVTWHERSR